MYLHPDSQKAARRVRRSQGHREVLRLDVAIDLAYTAAQRAFRAEVRAMDARTRAARSRCRRSKARSGLRAALRVGAHCSHRRDFGMITWPSGVRQTRSDPGRVVDLRGGVLPLPARRGASTRTASSCSARRSWSSARREQKARFLPKMARERRDLGAGLVGAERGQRHGRHPAPRAFATATHYVLNGQKTWVVARRVRRLAASGCSAPIRTASATTGLTLHPRAAATCPASRVRHPMQLDGEPGFAEVFLDDVRVPVAEPARRRRAGLARGDGDRRASSAA